MFNVLSSAAALPTTVAPSPRYIYAHTLGHTDDGQVGRNTYGTPYKTQTLNHVSLRPAS